PGRRGIVAFLRPLGGVAGGVCLVHVELGPDAAPGGTAQAQRPGALRRPRQRQRVVLGGLQALERRPGGRRFGDPCGVLGRRRPRRARRLDHRLGGLSAVGGPRPVRADGPRSRTRYPAREDLSLSPEVRPREWTNGVPCLRYGGGVGVTTASQLNLASL